MHDLNWRDRLVQPGLAWWTERPAVFTWGDYWNITQGSKGGRLKGWKMLKALPEDEPVHPLLARSALAPHAVGDDLVTLPWADLWAEQVTEILPSGHRYRSKIIPLVVSQMTEPALDRFVERVLDHAGRLFNDPSFQFKQEQVPVHVERQLPTCISESHRHAWSTLGMERVSRSITRIARSLIQQPAPSVETVQRWQRWSDVLACTTYSDAEAHVVQGLLHHGQSVSTRVTSPGSVLKSVPTMPLGWFVDLARQGMDLTACTSFYSQKKGNKWKRVPDAAARGSSGYVLANTFAFHLIDLAALRGRLDLMAWCLEQGMQPCEAHVNEVLPLLKSAVEESTPSDARHAQKRLINVERLHLQAVLTNDSDEPPALAPVRRRL